MSPKDTVPPPTLGRVAAIIVTFNSERYIDACIASLLAQGYPDLAVVVVDNASSDDTAQRARASGVHLIVNTENTGFAHANNQGAAFAVSELGANYILLVNPDTVSDPGLVEEMVTTAGSAPDIGVVQAKLFLMAERDLINVAGIKNHYIFFGYADGYRRPDPGGPDTEIAVASGACLMIKGEVLERLGYLFDDSFFMYHEDTDLSVRARLLGYRVMLSSKAHVWHDYRFGGNRRKFYYLEKNRLFLLFEVYRPLTLLLLAPAIIFVELQILVYSAMKGWFGHKLMGYVWLLRNMKHMALRRRAVQATRVVGDLGLMEGFVPDIAFHEVHNPAIEYITNPLLELNFIVVKALLRVLG